MAFGLRRLCQGSSELLSDSAPSHFCALDAEAIPFEDLDRCWPSYHYRLTIAPPSQGRVEAPQHHWNFGPTYNNGFEP